MEYSQLIEERRSMRSYDGEKKVTEEQIKELIEAALQAPTWKNTETGRYYCVMSEEVKERFVKECLPEGNAKKSAGATLIVTTFVKNLSGHDAATGTPDNECGNGWGFYDLGLQNENLVLKAKDMGLDTLIMGIRDGEKIRSLLSIPENEIVVSVIAVGYGNMEAKKPGRKALDEVLKFY